jgi:dienelactone hydrolase
VDALASHPRCEREGVAVVGFSLGGSYAFHVAALRPREVAAVVSFYGGYRFKPLMNTWDIRLSHFFADEDGRRWQRWFSHQDPQALIGKIRAPVLLLHGRKDTWIPSRQAQEYLEALRDRGIPADLALLPEADHDFMFSFDPSPGQQAVGYLADFLERRVAATLRRGCVPDGFGALPPCSRDVPLLTVSRPGAPKASSILHSSPASDPTP